MLVKRIFHTDPARKRVEILVGVMSRASMVPIPLLHANLSTKTPYGRPKVG